MKNTFIAICLLLSSSYVVKAEENKVEVFDFVGSWSGRAFESTLVSMGDNIYVENLLPQLNLLFNKKKEVFYVELNWKEPFTFAVPALEILPRLQSVWIKSLSNKNGQKRQSMHVDRRNCGLLETTENNTIYDVKDIQDLLLFRHLLTTLVKDGFGNCDAFSMNSALGAYLGQPLSYYSNQNHYTLKKVKIDAKTDMYDERVIKMSQYRAKIAKDQISRIREYFAPVEYKELMQLEQFKILGIEQKDRALQVLQRQGF